MQNLDFTGTFENGSTKRVTFSYETADQFMADYKTARNEHRSVVVLNTQALGGYVDMAAFPIIDINGIS